MRHIIEKEVVVVSTNYQEEWNRIIENGDTNKKKEKILLSGIVVCKNEEKNIAKCIESMIEAKLDEIVIVDTGSKDKTLEIVLRYMERYVHIALYKCEWKDSFALARNFAIECAKYDWVFFLDADERIIKQKNGEIQELISCFSNMCGDSIAIAPVIINSKSNKLYGNPRIFNKKQGYKYYGNVHEILREKESTYASVPFVGLNIEIEHYGYRQEIINKKIYRNIQLIEATIQEEPQNPIWYSYKLRDGRNVLSIKEKIMLYNKIRELCIPRLEEDFYQYCIDWAISILLPDIVCEKELKIAEKIIEDMKNYSALKDADIFYLETIVQLLRIEYSLMDMEKKCTQMLTHNEFASSIINNEGYHIDELKMMILEKEHKYGEYYKLKDFLFSVGYIQLRE